MKHKSKYILNLVIIVILFSCNYSDAKNGQVEKSSEKKSIHNEENTLEEESKENSELQNIGEKIMFSDYIEIHQNFTKLSNNEAISKSYSLNLFDQSFVALSAYTLDINSDGLKLYYRIFNDQKWGNWKNINEDLETNSKNRKVYGLENIFENIEKIQFKSNLLTNEKVVFNLFVPKNL